MKLINLFFLCLVIVNVLAFFYFYLIFSFEIEQDLTLVEYKAKELKDYSVLCSDCSDNYLDLSDCKKLFDGYQKIEKYKKNNLVFCKFYYFE